MSDQDERPTASAERRDVFDDPRNVKRVFYALFTVCGLMLAIDLLDLFGVLFL